MKDTHFRLPFPVSAAFGKARTLCKTKNGGGGRIFFFQTAAERFKRAPCEDSS